MLRTAVAIAMASCWAHAAELSPDEIVRRSVINTQANWKLAPQYAFTERDVITKGGRHTMQKFEVVMIDGSPYNKLIGRDGKPLPPAEAAAADAKMRQEIDRRRRESPSARSQRIAKYERERQQDHALLQEMVKALEYHLTGEENVRGRQCYVLDAEPRTDFRPTSRETKVLAGMRGRMWVDKQLLQWVKVHAEVFHPVSFGLFIAHVEPGTEFTLEQAPVADGKWMPVHFITRVKANVLVFARNSVDDETYSNYRRNDLALAGR